MEKMKAHVGRREKRLKLWGAKLNALVAGAEESGTDAWKDYDQRMADLKSKYHAAQLKLDELSTAGSDQWLTFKAGAESAWKEFEGAFKKLTN